MSAAEGFNDGYQSDNSNDDDGPPRLSTESVKALNEFFEESMNINAGKSNEFYENWQLSQFWYDDSTANDLAYELLTEAGMNGSIALISCPTVYNPLTDLSQSLNVPLTVRLFEFDKRFAKHGNDYVYYDYNNPLAIPMEYKNGFDIVIADPPFLSGECLSKVTQTINFLTKGKIIVCTGTIMRETVYELLYEKDIRESMYKPKHTRRLENEFGLYLNYPSGNF